MGRHSLSIFSAISASLFLFFMVPWIQSDERRHELRFSWRGKNYALSSERGTFGVDNQTKIEVFQKEVQKSYSKISRVQAHIGDLLKEWSEESAAVWKNRLTIDPTLKSRIADQEAYVRALEAQQSAPPHLLVRHFVHFWVLAIAAACAIKEAPESAAHPAAID
jgi:hypothetical protein